MGGGKTLFVPRNGNKSGGGYHLQVRAPGFGSRLPRYETQSVIVSRVTLGELLLSEPPSPRP